MIMSMISMVFFYDYFCLVAYFSVEMFLRSLSTFVYHIIFLAEETYPDLNLNKYVIDRISLVLLLSYLEPI